MNKNKNQAKGFTLLELLIVISVLAILSVALILVLNPTESMRKSRDAQRINDLGTMKTAIGLYLTEVTSPDLDGNVANGCLTTANTGARIFYSAELADTSSCTANVTEGGDVTTGSTFSTTDFCKYPGTTGASAVDGTGWLPVNLSAITGGAPISNMPLDPVNTIASATAPASTDLVYRYACQSSTADGKPAFVFEINAQLESDAYTISDDKRAKDGGDNNSYYEIGTNLKLIGSGTNF